MKITKSYPANIPFPELRGSLNYIQWPAMGEIKYDGEFGTLICSTATIISKSGRRRELWDKVSALSNLLKRADINDNLLCEIIYKEGKRGDLYKLLSNQDNDDSLNIKVFDIDRRFDDYLTRSELLLKYIPTDYLVTKKMLNSKEEAMEWAQDVLSIGYEGIVVKNLTGSLVFGPCDWVKIKPRDTNKYMVAYIDPIKERIEVSVTSANGTKNVGVKVSTKIKSTLRLGQQVDIEHQGILDTGGLRHPVFKKASHNS